MQRTSILAVLAVVGAAVVAASRDAGFDLVGAGIVGGALAGTSVALLSHSLVRTALGHDTRAAFQALTVGFGAKFLGAILPWAAMVFLPQAQGIADPTAYLLSYASCVLLVMGAGVFDQLRASSDGASGSTADAATPERTANPPSSTLMSESTSSISPGPSPLESAS